MKQRIITGVCGAVFVIVWLGFRNTVAFNIIIALAVIMAMYEALVATKYVKNLPLIVLSVLYSAIVPFFQLIKFFPFGMTVSAAFIFAMMALMLWQHNNIKLSEISYSFMMSLIIPFSLSSVLYINAMPTHNSESLSSVDGLFYVLLALSAAWICDTGAYFVGSMFGKHKLAPEISPKKTIEGSLGGILCTLIFYIIMGLVWNFGVLGDKGSVNFIALVVLAVAGSIAGMIGDLSFSFIKRSCHLKDFGKIMPGHGGILDRVDSLMLAAPLVWVYLNYFPIVVRV